MQLCRRSSEQVEKRRKMGLCGHDEAAAQVLRSQVVGKQILQEQAAPKH